MVLENDLPGVADLVVLNRFMRGLRFEDLRPAPIRCPAASRPATVRWR